MWGAAWLFLRRYKTALLPLAVALATVGAIHLLFRWDDRRIEAAETRGADQVRMKAELRVIAYETEIVALKSRKDSVRRVVDTLWKRTTVSVTRVDSAMNALPPDVRAQPSVVTLMQAVTQLQGDVAQVMEIRLTERAAYESVIAADSVALRAMATGWDETTKQLERMTQDRNARVSKGKAYALASGALAGGIAVGKWVLPLLKGK